MPVLASVGSVLVGSLAAVIISSKTESLSAWLSSLNGTNKSSSGGGNGSHDSHNSNGRPSPERPEEAAGAATMRRQQQQRLSPAASSFPAHTGGRALTADDGKMAASSPLEEGVAATRTEVVPRDAGGNKPGLVRTGERALLAMVLAFSLLFAYLSSLVGSSDLLGCFLGGLAFSGVPGVQRVWTRQVRVMLAGFVCLLASLGVLLLGLVLRATVPTFLLRGPLLQSSTTPSNSRIPPLNPACYRHLPSFFRLPPPFL